jgi:hypothetical protein
MSSTRKTPHCPHPACNLSEAGVAAAAGGDAEVAAVGDAEAEAADALEAVAEAVA